jgi:hypothetical protein
MGATDRTGIRIGRTRPVHYSSKAKLTLPPGVAAAEACRRTLLCDLDPQAAASFYLRVRASKAHDAERLIQGGRTLDRQIRESDFPNLHVLPAKMGFRHLGLKLATRKRSRNRLRETFGDFSKIYALVVIDSPPNITLLSENIIASSDLLLCPVIPTTLSLRTWDQLQRFLAKEKISRHEPRTFFPMAERRKKNSTPKSSVKPMSPTRVSSARGSPWPPQSNVRAPNELRSPRLTNAPPPHELSRNCGQKSKIND